ncbi:MAG TPA: RiPP maturation radical SAM C-methyltransferase [Pyrinomonadaceae bacterium]
MLPLTQVRSSSREKNVFTSVALVNMPFALADRPSIQCGLLKAGLIRVGHEVDVHYLNLELAAEIGAEAYKTISQLRADQFLGEWLFSVAAFGYRPDESDYFAACPSLASTCQELGWDFDELCRLRNEVFPSLIDRWAEKIAWHHYTVVGFTCTFEQNTPAFALARRIKEKHPEIVIVFGGANFDGGMGEEYLKALPFIDYVVVGEGDTSFPQLVAHIARGADGLGVPGVIGRVGGEAAGSGTSASVSNLDGLPDPNYDEYFDTLFQLGRERVIGDRPPLLLLETARGCWWGEKHHCTFCGLNANSMQFRSKPPLRVRDELQRLSARYKIVNFEAVDNIMDLSYLDQLCAPLIEQRSDYQIFYEVKANLTPAQLGQMARAGITAIQPGIESLNSHVLSLMRKGTNMLNNVRLLKWAHYYGMRVGWNILTGFPGELPEDYEEQARVLKQIFHLPPPAGCGPIWLERFSPYFFDPSFQVKNLKPKAAYRFIYQPSKIDLKKIAYFFDHEFEAPNLDEQHQELNDVVYEWKSRWDRPPAPVLVYQRAPDWIQVIDRRLDQPAVHAFDRREAFIYEFCGETHHSVEIIRKKLREADGDNATTAEVASVLERFCELGLMLEEDGSFLSLALPVNPNW